MYNHKTARNSQESMLFSCNPLFIWAFPKKKLVNKTMNLRLRCRIFWWCRLFKQNRMACYNLYSPLLPWWWEVKTSILIQISIEKKNKLMQFELIWKYFKADKSLVHCEIMDGFRWDASEVEANTRTRWF